MKRLLISATVVAAVLAVLAPTPARGVTYDKLAYMTFTAPVQIPGVTLNAGTYRFHLTNPETSRNVLQVLSHDGSIVYAMFHTIPDARSVVTDEATVTFKETPEGVPPAVKSLFYGGEHRGYEFVYPKGGPNMIAEVLAQPEITYVPMPPVAEPKLAEVPAPVVEPRVEPLPAAVEEPVPAPVELPRTASPLPLLATGGAASLLVALGLTLLRRRAN